MLTPELEEVLAEFTKSGVDSVRLINSLFDSFKLLESLAKPQE